MIVHEKNINFKSCLSSTNSGNFWDVMKQQIETLDPALLPLQQGLVHGSYVTDDPINAVILDCSEAEDHLQIKAGIFYNSIIAGCSCADDPTPIDTNQEYCVLEFEVNKETGVAEVRLLQEL